VSGIPESESAGQAARPLHAASGTNAEGTGEANVAAVAGTRVGLNILASGLAPVGVVVGGFEPTILARGLLDLLMSDPRVLVYERDLSFATLERGVAQWMPQLAIVGDPPDLAVIPRLRSIRAETEIIVLAADPDRVYGLAVLAAGASCISSLVPEAELLDMVHKISAGGRFFASSDGERAERRYPSNARALTRREKQVLALLVTGATEAQIACALKISPRTAELHTRRIRSKLGVLDRRDLVGMPLPPR